MNSSLINRATDALQLLLGQSRYRVDVHGCGDFWMFCVTMRLSHLASHGGMM